MSFNFGIEFFLVIVRLVLQNELFFKMLCYYLWSNSYANINGCEERGNESIISQHYSNIVRKFTVKREKIQK